MKASNVNKSLLRQKKLALITASILGLQLVGGFVSDGIATIANKREYFDFSKEEPYGTDALIWTKEKNSECEVASLTYNPTNIIRSRVFIGSAGMTHYRIGLNSGYHPADNEYGEWLKIPDDGVIVIDRKNLPEDQYDKEVFIDFGKYVASTNTFVIEDNRHIVASHEESSYENIEKYESMKREICGGIQKLIEPSDSDFDKVKKIYDYIIDHLNYRHHGTITIDELVNCDLKRDKYGVYYVDCTGYSEVFKYVCDHLGIECLTVRTNGHVWNIVKVNGKYYHIDATYSDSDSWTKTSKYHYFLVSDQFMLAENRWFTPEKDVKCEESYDLTGLIDEPDAKNRAIK